MKWLPVKNFEGYYEVSDGGEIRSVDRVIYDINGRSRKLKGGPKVLSSNQGGYLIARLRRDGLQKNETIHKLVYTAFVGDIPSGMEIDHIDNNKENNTLSNLRVLTHAQNMDRVDNKRSKRILIVYKDGTTEYYSSIIEASNSTGISRDTISRILKGTSTGYKVFSKYKIKYIVLAEDSDSK